jgi:type I restriction enzyme, S subunit
MRTQRYPLPRGWSWKSLGEVVARIEAGRSPKTLERPAQPGECGVLKVSAVTLGEFRPAENKAFLADHKPADCSSVRKGDLLFSRANTTELVGAVATPDRDYPNLYLSDKTLRIVPAGGEIEPRYLVHLLRAGVSREYLESVATGTSGSMRNVSQQKLLAMRVPVPPLPEQRRIAAILDKADAIRRKRQEAVRLTDDLVRSAFLDMFGDPVTNPKRWPSCRLGEVAEFVGGGTPSRFEPRFFSGSIPWATAKDITGEVLEDTQEHITEEALACSATRLVPAGAILLVVKSKVLLRRLPVSIAAVRCCFGQDLKGIIPGVDIPSRYLARHLRLGQQALLSRARGVNTEGLTLDHLRDYAVMMPGHAVRQWDAFEAAVSLLRAKQMAFSKTAEAQLATLILRVFRGAPLTP